MSLFRDVWCIIYADILLLTMLDRGMICHPLASNYISADVVLSTAFQVSKLLEVNW